MFKILTIVALILSSMSAFASNDQVSVYTLEVVESMLWHDGLSVPSTNQASSPRLSEELEVAIELLDAELE